MKFDMNALFKRFVKKARVNLNTEKMRISRKGKLITCPIVKCYGPRKEKPCKKPNRKRRKVSAGDKA